jgi:hypothetical protein
MTRSTVDGALMVLHLVLGADYEFVVLCLPLESRSE